MNGNFVLRAVLVVTGVVALASPSAALDFPYVFQDPFKTVPEAVEKGVTLPGDQAPFSRAYREHVEQPLTLGEAVDVALSNNQKVKSAWADIKAQAAVLGGAYAAYLPVLNGTVNWTKDTIDYSDPRFTSTDVNRYTIQASANWRLFDFGGRPAYRLAAVHMVSAAVATYDATLQEAMSSVIKAYCDAVTARASLDAKTADEDIARRTLQSAKEREAKGAISQSDTLRATTALARASLDRSRAGGEYQKALAVLRYQMGVPGATELLLPSQFQEQYGGELEKKELSLWLEEAQKSHPAIVAARKKVEASRQQVTVSKSAGLPFVSFVANYYQNTRPGEAATPSGAKETTLTVGISIPLFDGFASTYKVRGAQAQVEKQSADMADTEQQIAMGVIRAYSDATAAMQNLEASATLVESAKNALAVSQRKYEKGAADVTEVLSTQSALADAWNERIRCLAEWHSARLQLLASAGELGRSALTQ